MRWPWGTIVATLGVLLLLFAMANPADREVAPVGQALIWLGLVIAVDGLRRRGPGA